MANGFAFMPRAFESLPYFRKPDTFAVKGMELKGAPQV